MKLYFIIVSTLLSISVHAQQVVPNLARVGGKGIFVLAGEKISDSKGPVTGYRISRKASNETQFREVAHLKAVPSLAEFRKNLEASNRFLPYKQDLSDYRVDSLWLIGKRSGQLISLKAKGYSLPVLAGFNMIWLDEKVVEGEQYQYMVTAEGGSYAALSEPVVFSRSVRIAPVAYERGLYNQPQGQMLLYWLAAGKDKPVHMEAFRSENSNAYQKIPASISFYPGRDTFQYQVKDSTAIPGRMYTYFVRSWDALGNLAPTSDTISIASLDYIQMPLPRQVKMQGDSAKRGIRISWDLPAAPLLQELTLFRSDNSIRGFQPIAKLSVDQNSYLDEEVIPSIPYFYYFEAKYKTIEKAKRTITFSGLFIDTARPLAPQNVVATSTSKGLKISWEQEAKNLSGFWLYRAERGRPLQLISTMIPAVDTSARYSFHDLDSSLSGGKFYQYAVKAISGSHVESVFSDTVVARPMWNTPMPMPPMQVSTTIEEDKIIIFWDAVSNYDELVSGYVLIRNAVLHDKQGKHKIDSIYCTTNMYVDSAVKPGDTYSYSVISQSIFGNHSRPSSIVAAGIGKRLLSSPSSVVANYTSRGVLLQWEPPADDDQLQCVVYRYERGSKPAKLGIAKGGQHQYLDATAKKGKQYFYYVKATAAGADESSKSNEAMVKF